MTSQRRNVLGGGLGAIAASAVIISALTGCGSGPRPLPTVKDTAMHWYSVENWPNARGDLEEYLSRKPDDLDMRVLYGNTLLEMNEPLRAKEEFQKVFDFNPANEGAVEGLARAMLGGNERDALIEFLNRRIADRGTVGDYLRLGRFAAEIGHADDAQEALLTAARLDRGTTIAPQLALADFYKSVNDQKSEARRLRMALYIEPNNQRIRQRLADLGEVVGPSIPMRPAEAQ
ncbi:MAG: hypothetical protein SFY95_01880 [Planctomycetota bacterium]|nr:hypothetical protein [Planctomycetota bacterium]